MTDYITLKRQLSQAQWRYARSTSAEQANMANRDMMLLNSKIKRIISCEE